MVESKDRQDIEARMHLLKRLISGIEDFGGGDNLQPVDTSPFREVDTRANSYTARFGSFSKEDLDTSMVNNTPPQRRITEERLELLSRHKEAIQNGNVELAKEIQTSIVQMDIEDCGDKVKVEVDLPTNVSKYVVANESDFVGDDERPTEEVQRVGEFVETNINLEAGKDSLVSNGATDDMSSSALGENETVEAVRELSEAEKLAVELERNAQNDEVLALAYKKLLEMCESGEITRKQYLYARRTLDGEAVKLHSKTQEVKLKTLEIAAVK